MKKTLAALSVLGVSTTPCYALDINEDLAVDVTFSILSQYRSRGISQSQNNPAIQFDGMLYSKTTGLYLGLWTSSVDYGRGSDVRQELDYYAGWFIPFNEDINLDVGYARYTYPKGNYYNLSETYGILSAYGFKVAAQYSSDNVTFDKNQSTMYTWFGYETSLPYDTTIGIRYGKMDYKDPIFVTGNGDTRNSYNEWEVKISREFFGVDWAISYVDTDLSSTECNNAFQYDDLCSATAVVSISKKY